MIFGIQQNLKWYQLALIPVALPIGIALLAPFAVVALASAARDRIENGFWG